MPIVAIVCEYNPFHKGHAYQISKIREEFGNDTSIIGIMSGNYTQRGECAIADKGARAKCAVLEGVNLILELPFPFSMSSAELFASAAVSIIDDLGIVDYISFGSESGDLTSLERLADVMLSDEFDANVKAIASDAKCRGVGYPEVMEKAVRSIDKSIDISFTSNNILAIEYIKALKLSHSSAKPHTIKRMGASYNDATFSANESLASATAIRNEVRAKNISALEYVPHSTKNILLDELMNGSFPCDTDKLSTSIITSLRLNSPSTDTIFDCNGGLYNRLREKSFEANNLNTLLRLCETKAYTNARLRRAVMYAFLGVTSSDVKCTPLYTQVLAFDGQGQAILKNIRKRSKIAVLTKPSNVKGLTSDAHRQKMFADRADSIFQLTKPTAQDGNFAIRFTPYVKE